MCAADARSQIDTHSVYGAALSAEAILSLGSMEGIYEPVVAARPAVALPARSVLLPGYAASFAVAAVALSIHYLPFGPFTVAGEATRHPISTAIIAILVGLAVRNTLTLPDSLKVGCKHIIKKLIPVAIVFTGAGLNLGHIAAIGLSALVVVVLCISVGMLAGYYVGRLLGLNWKTALLLGTGTSICGNSAIAAVAPLIDAEEDDLVLSIATVNLFGLLAMLAWPVVGGLMQLSDQAFGIWAGTSIHAVPQVVAAGFAFSPEAGSLATLVKLVRVTMLAPLVFILAVVYAKSHAAGASTRVGLTVRYARLVPWFVWGFVGLAALNTLGLLPTLEFRLVDFWAGGAAERAISVSLEDLMTRTGKLLLALAMAAIGLEVNLRMLGRVGQRAFLAGLLSTAVLGLASLALITLLI